MTEIALSPFLSFARTIADRTTDKCLKSPGTIDKESVRGAIDEIVVKGEDRELINAANRAIEGVTREPAWAVGVRAAVRPLMTLILTITFVGMICLGLGLFDLKEPNPPAVFSELFTAFIGIYGSIIGFWFGERTAEKARKAVKPE